MASPTIGTTPAVTISPNMPGLTFNSQGSTPLATPSAPTAPVGVQAKSPTTNISAPSNTISSAQTAPRDLSGTYANIGGTIYNTKSGTKFSKPEDFFKDAGVSDFNNIKFNTAYTPTGKETVYGQPSAAQSYGFGDGTSYDASGKQIHQTPAQPVPSAPQPSSATVPVTSTGLYTPPNQGTTGVSQGGIIGNLINMANNETPEVTQSRQALKDLETDYGKQNADVLSRPEGLTQQTGQQGILASLFAAKQNAAQNAVTNALTSQSQQIGATGTAGSLNAPIVNPQTQGLVNPSANSTTNSTTSGANLESLVGTRVGADGKTTEYFDKSTGQGFSTPQQLADFVNKQLGSNVANAGNVFDVLKNQGSGGSAGDVVQPSDPYYKTLTTAAQLLATNQVDAANSLMGSMPAAVKAQVIRMAQAQGYNSNVAAGTAGAIQSNIQGAGTAATDAARQTYIAQYPAVQQLNQALNNVQSAANITLQNAQGQNINPLSFVPGNTIIADARKLFSSSGQAVFDSNLANLEAAIRNIYSANGGSTPTVIGDQVNGIINGTASMDTLKALINTAQQEGNARLTNAQATAQNAFNQTQSSATGSTNTSAPAGLSYDSIINQYL